jgi:hypothetical protein
MNGIEDGAMRLLQATREQLHGKPTTRTWTLGAWGFIGLRTRGLKKFSATLSRRVKSWVGLSIFWGLQIGKDVSLHSVREAREVKGIAHGVRQRFLLGRAHR